MIETGARPERERVIAQLNEWADAIAATGTTSVGHVAERVQALRDAVGLLRQPATPSEGADSGEDEREKRDPGVEEDIRVMEALAGLIEGQTLPAMPITVERVSRAVQDEAARTFRRVAARLRARLPSDPPEGSPSEDADALLHIADDIVRFVPASSPHVGAAQASIATLRDIAVRLRAWPGERAVAHVLKILQHDRAVLGDREPDRDLAAKIVNSVLRSPSVRPEGEAEDDGRRWDIWYGEKTHVEHHFCREWEGERGCYGTNPDHGMTTEEVFAHLCSERDAFARTETEGPTPPDDTKEEA